MWGWVMNDWVKFSQVEPSIHQMVHTSHNGKGGTDWVDSEMLRDARAGVKPVTYWMKFPAPVPEQGQMELNFGDSNV